MNPSRLFATFLSALLLSSCSNDDGPPTTQGEEEGTRPYGHYMLTDYGSYVKIPDHPDLNPTGGMTWEGWVRLDNTAGSNVLVYKKLYYENEGYYVDVRERDGESLLYSYLGYDGSLQQAGKMPIHTWIHWAVTTDGTYRRHYLNGELVGEFTESAGVFVPSSEPLFLPKSVLANTGLAEFRLWSLVRTQEEIKSTMNKDITSPMPGLVAVWPFEENAEDIIGGHDGSLHNNPKFKTWSE